MLSGIGARITNYYMLITNYYVLMTNYLKRQVCLLSGIGARIACSW